jgi:hypothetical protein
MESLIVTGYLVVHPATTVVPPIAVPDPEPWPEWRTTGRKNLLDAVAHGGPGVAALMGRIGELDDLLQKGAARAAEARGELAMLENRIVDEGDLRRALASFMPVWSQLFAWKKSRAAQKGQFGTPGCGAGGATAAG